jgi:hypothetical protein
MAINKVIYNGTTLIDLTADTVDAAHLLSGYKAHSRAGAVITGTCDYDSNTSDATASPADVLAGETYYAGGSSNTGTMVNNGAVTGTISTKAQQYTIPVGYHDGSGKVSISSTEQAKIIAGNIKSGVQILGVTGNYSGASVTAQAKTATPTANQQTILPDTGYDYLSQVTVAAIPYVETANTYGTTVTIG